MSRRVVGPIYRPNIDQTAGAVDDRTDHKGNTEEHLPAGRPRQAPPKTPGHRIPPTAILTLILILTFVTTLTVRSLSRSTSATS